VRVRVLRWSARRGLTDPEDMRETLAWENSRFSLDAEARSDTAAMSAPLLVEP
jgi:hypothetical protein